MVLVFGILEPIFVWNSCQAIIESCFYDQNDKCRQVCSLCVCVSACTRVQASLNQSSVDHNPDQSTPFLFQLNTPFLILFFFLFLSEIYVGPIDKSL